MTRIVINRMHGGFDLSVEALNLYAQLTGSDKISSHWNIKRDDPVLIQVVETLGSKADNGTKLRIVDIPDDVEWIIKDYDGLEWIAEKHRIWY